MALSTQRAVSDGTMVRLDLSVEYFERTEIEVFFGGNLTPEGSGWSWIGTTDKAISFSPAVAAGTEVMVKRSTAMEEPRHSYTGGAQFLAETMDENFIQMLRIAQEAKEGSTLSEIFNDFNMHGFQIQNLGPATQDNHPVSLGVYKADAQGANQAKLAAQSAQAASEGARDRAVTAENASKASEDAAAGFATTAGQHKTAAETARSGAETAKSGADSAKAGADYSAALAQDWATKTAAEVVVGQGYGAKKYAQDAASSAQAAQNSASSINDSNLVHKSGAETISGEKTFSSGILVASVNGGSWGSTANLLRNPLYSVNQRGITATSSNNTRVADGWTLSTNVGNVSLERVTDAAATPSVHASTFLQLRTNTAGASAYSTFAVLYQLVEGYRAAILRYGTSSAKVSVLSFRASASAPAVLTVAIRNYSGTRSIVFPVSVSPAPQDYTLVVPGESTGAWEVATGVGANVTFAHTVGGQYTTSTQGTWLTGNYYGHSTQTDGMASAGLVFRISDAHWEVGGVKTPLPILDYQEELRQAMRYYEKSYSDWHSPGSVTTEGREEEFRYPGTGIQQYGAVRFKVPKRNVPTIVLYSDSSGATGKVTQSNGSEVAASVANAGANGFRLNWTNTAGNFGAAFHWTADTGF